MSELTQVDFFTRAHGQTGDSGASRPVGGTAHMRLTTVNVAPETGETAASAEAAEQQAAAVGTPLVAETIEIDQTA